MGKIISFPGVPPPGDDPLPDDPLPVGDNAPAGSLTFDEWYDSEFLDWLHMVENMPVEREGFLDLLVEVRDRLNGWVVP